MTAPKLPTAQEIAELPRWAQVAFAARCARRAVPYFRYFWPDAPSYHLEAVESAVVTAERAAAVGSKAGAGRAVAVALSVIMDDERHDLLYSGAMHVAAAAHSAASAAAKSLVAPGHAAQAAASAAAADEIYESSYLTNRAQHRADGAREIRQDFDHLIRTAREQHWSDDTLVSPEAFGPMWPEGAPAVWPVEPESEDRTVSLRPPALTPPDSVPPLRAIVPAPVPVPAPVEPIERPLEVGAPLPGLEMWELVEPLGKGGFGEVWLVRKTGTNHRRAVKFCFHEVAKNRLTHTTHESKVARHVEKHMGTPDGCHPNIVPLLECNLTGPTPWLMYEFVDGGRTLADVVKELGTQPPPERLKVALRVLPPIANAVGRFHRLNVPIVHRDLKPKNVLMAGDVPRITDFGIGGAAVTAAISDATGGHTELTVDLPTILLRTGTPPHASAQQLAGDPPHPADDVYALGVMLYQVLIGKPAAEVRGGWQRRLRADSVPSVLIDLIDASTAEEREDRPADAAAWAAALTPLLPGSPPAPIRRNANVPGVWHSRPADEPDAEWEWDEFSTREIAFEPDHVYRLECDFRAGDADLEGLWSLADLNTFIELSLAECSDVTDLTPLGALLHLKSLSLRECDALTDLAPLVHLEGLEELDLSFCYELEDLAPLAKLTNLKVLKLVHCAKVTDLTPLSKLAHLEELFLSRCYGVAELAPLSGLPNLQQLELNFITRPVDLSPLVELNSLKELSLRESTGVTDLAPLTRLTGLERLLLTRCENAPFIPEQLQSRVHMFPPVPTLLKPSG